MHRSNNLLVQPEKSKTTTTISTRRKSSFDDLSIIVGRQLMGQPQKLSITSSNELDRIVKFASANKSLARLLPAMVSTNSQINNEIETLQNHQNIRLKEALSLLEETQRICLEMNIPFLVLKSFDALPDLGHDIDLLVGANLPKIRGELLQRLKCSPVTLTFCDRQAGKFSTFIEGYTFDFELYARISQLGEDYISSQTLLENRRRETVFTSQTYLCSQTDRLLITCIHTMYRHGKLRLSDVNIVFDAFKAGIDQAMLLRNVDKAGIQKGFALFINILQVASNNFVGNSNILPSELIEYSDRILEKDPILARSSRALHATYPMKLPLWLCILLFLYKAAADISKNKSTSALRSLVAPMVLMFDKIIPLKIQKLIAIRIW